MTLSILVTAVVALAVAGYFFFGARKENTIFSIHEPARESELSQYITQIRLEHFNLPKELQEEAIGELQDHKITFKDLEDGKIKMQIHQTPVLARIGLDAHCHYYLREEAKDSIILNVKLPKKAARVLRKHRQGGE